jgi:hypothetical protein
MARFTNDGKSLFIDGKKVLCGFESFNGWYWFATEKKGEQLSDFGDGKGVPDTIWFGLVQGFEEEWGYFSQAEIERLGNRAWKIKACDLSYSGRRSEAQ